MANILLKKLNLSSNCYGVIEISLEMFPWILIDSNPALVQVIASYQISN